MNPQKDEGAGIVYDDPVSGPTKRYTHLTYGMGFRVTREMWEDDLYGKMKKMPKALGRSALYAGAVRFPHEVLMQARRQSRGRHALGGRNLGLFRTLARLFRG